jgi:hypothetical protein
VLLDAEIVPVTVTQAAEKLEKASSTIRCWARRYDARKLRKFERKVVYDYGDLSVIEREIRHGHPVPATWQERAAIALRCPLREAERDQVAA